MVMAGRQWMVESGCLVVASERLMIDSRWW